MSRPYRRSARNFLLDGRFQLKYAVAMALSGGLIFGSMSLLLYDKVRDNSALVGLDAVDAFELELAGRLAASDNPLIWQLGTFCLLLMLLLFLVGVLATHRIIGPLKVVERSVQILTEGGRLPPRVLRQGDEFQALFDGVNALNEALQTTQAQELALIEATLARVEARLAAAPDSAGKGALEAGLRSDLSDLEVWVARRAAE
jgi:hypothetical protein